MLDHLGIETADFCGFSLGGLVTLEAAIRHPERVDRLMLAAIHFRPDGYHEEITDPMNSSRTPNPPCCPAPLTSVHA